MATVHDEVAAGHKRASIAKEKEGGAFELRGLCEAAHHVRGFPGLAQAGDLLEVLTHHGGQDVAGADAVDADAALAAAADGTPLHREVSRELDDGGLGRVVHGRK